MRKPFTIMFMLFSFISVSAQDKTTPTKQETMDWIANKFKAVMCNDSKFISYSDGVFTYSRVVESLTFIYKINLNLVTGYKNNKESKVISITGEYIVDREIYKYGNLDTKDTDNTEIINRPDGCVVYGRINIALLDGLEDRMNKAFENLIRFNKSLIKTEKF